MTRAKKGELGDMSHAVMQANGQRSIPNDRGFPELSVMPIMCYLMQFSQGYVMAPKSQFYEAEGQQTLACLARGEGVTMRVAVSH